MSETIHFLGVPYNSDGTPPEAEHPPQHLRDAGLLDRLRSSFAVHDLGDLTIPASAGLLDSKTRVLNWSSWQVITSDVSTCVGGILADGGWPLVVGGDCSILVGIMTAVVERSRRSGLFFVDGHGDFHTPSTSPTGEPADMELAALTGRAPNPSSGRHERLLLDEDVVVVGIRESDGIENAPIRVLNYDGLVRTDIATAVRDLAAALSGMPVWLHLDVDVIDPGTMPVIFPAAPGLTADQTRTVLATVIESCRVIGMDVACFHPNLDRDGTATHVIVDVLAGALEPLR